MYWSQALQGLVLGTVFKNTQRWWPNNIQIFLILELFQWTTVLQPISFLPHSGLQPLKQNQKLTEVLISSVFDNLSVKKIKLLKYLCQRVLRRCVITDVISKPWTFLVHVYCRNQIVVCIAGVIIFTPMKMFFRSILTSKISSRKSLFKIF